jgi:hypothetical protein
MKEWYGKFLLMLALGQPMTVSPEHHVEVASFVQAYLLQPVYN